MTQALKREIKDLSDAHTQESNKMAQAQQTMRALQEEKYALETKLSQTKAAANSQVIENWRDVASVLLEYLCICHETIDILRTQLSNKSL
jgi:hypothetical protein